MKMAGLSALAMGGNFALLALVYSIQQMPDFTRASSLAVIAFALACLAFRIRAGHGGWVPIVLVLYAVFLIANALLPFTVWHMSGKNGVVAITVIGNWVVPVLCAMLTLSGYRGWRWLKQNGIFVSY
jgi:hypothetical protein